MATKKEVTQDVIRAIRRAIDEYGTEKRLAQCSNINQQTLNHISCGKVNSMTSATWERLFPHIARYLPGASVDHRTTGAIRLDQHASAIIVTGDGNQILTPPPAKDLPMTDRIIETNLFSAEEKIFLIALIRAEEKRRRARRPRREEGEEPKEETEETL